MAKKPIVKPKTRIKAPIEVEIPKEKEVVFAKEHTRIQTAEGWLRSQLNKRK